MWMGGSSALGISFLFKIEIERKSRSFGSDCSLSGRLTKSRGGGEHVATVKKKIFTLFHCRFSVDVPGPNDLEAKGNFLDHEYEFSLEGKVVAQVSKRWIALTDSYVIEVAPDADEVLILACAVVIDLACHEDRDH